MLMIALSNKMHKELTTPILFLIFNRPDTTKGVFEAIRKAKPPKLFVAADGARPDKPGEWEKCQKVRGIAIVVDWDCEVKTLFRDTNLGCKVAVSRAIDWFFQHVEEGIILEDDCLPTQSFFWFCQELLEKYRYDERVMMISGDNFQFGRKRTDYSYYFSRFTHIWGWASWRRAWKHFDVNMKLWPEIRDGGWLNDWLGDKKRVEYWTQIFEKVYKGKIDTWDYQWTFACWVQNGLSILPNVNLVSNIGFGFDAVHTKGQSKFNDMKTEPVVFPLSHPKYILRDSVADAFNDRSMFSTQPFPIRAINKLKRLLK